MKGTEFVVDALAREGIDHAFLVPGGLIDSFYPALCQTKGIEPIVAAHEGGAAYMADGYARASGKFGVCFCIGGPGATNTVTALATAMTDQSPLLLLTGEMATNLEGLGGFQDASPDGLDDISILKTVARLSLSIENPLVLRQHLHQALGDDAGAHPRAGAFERAGRRATGRDRAQVFAEQRVFAVVRVCQHRGDPANLEASGRHGGEGGDPGRGGNRAGRRPGAVASVCRAVRNAGRHDAAGQGRAAGGSSALAGRVRLRRHAACDRGVALQFARRAHRVGLRAQSAGHAVLESRPPLVQGAGAGRQESGADLGATYAVDLPIVGHCDTVLGQLLESPAANTAAFTATCAKRKAWVEKIRATSDCTTSRTARATRCRSIRRG